MNKDCDDLARNIAPGTLIGFRDRWVWWRKVFNTFFYIRFLWPVAVTDDEHEMLIKGNYKETLFRKIFRKMFWFWPRLIEAVTWSAGGADLEKDPQHFSVAYPNHEEALMLLSQLIGNKEKSILDLGCNMGRHLNVMHGLGHRNLFGVDIMGAALKEFEVKFPETFSATVLKQDTFQRFLLSQPNRSFNATYTFGATVELVHPSFDIVREVCRVTNDLVLFMINENGQSYPRFWTYEFNKSGFDLVYCIRPWRQNDTLGENKANVFSLLVYRRQDC